MDEFERITAQLRTLKRAAKCEWRNPTERAAFLREQLQLQRREWLDILVPNRICPCCLQVKAGTRCWVIFPVLRHKGPNADRVRAAGKNGEYCACRSCVMKYFPSVWGAGASRGRLRSK